MSIDENADVDLGTMLLEKKLITEAQLNECRQQQKLKGGFLSQHLIDAGHIQDSDLTTCLTCQYGFCYLPLGAYTVSESVRELLPAQLVRDYCCVPIEKNDRLLSVVMADPLNKGVIEVLRQVSQCEVIVFISSRKEIKETIEKYYEVPLQDIDLDKFKDDPLLRDNLSHDLYIKTTSYSGPNRRRYARWRVELPAEFSYYPQTVRTKIRNISMGGICFGSYIALAKGSQIAMNIQLDNARRLTCVLEVARCESKNRNGSLPTDSSLALYEAGAFFNFLTQEDHGMLADFLKSLPNA